MARGGSALYVLCSTGAIVATIYRYPEPEIVTPNALSEIGDCQRRTKTGRDWAPLEKLRQYVQAKGPRGPVDGWGKMPW